ncbi:hypothetical protein ACH40F_45070 [Streptomyces sp. NPDC020794]|uniref:hypothetical protein n=1 Tax=unclassified Streptomyces TaxID=2593676 RepID=UPI0036E0B76E
MRRWITTLALTLVGALIAPAAHAAPAETPQAQLQAVFSSPAGRMLMGSIADMVTDLSEPKAFADALHEYGPTGDNRLSDYQVGLNGTNLELALSCAPILKKLAKGKTLTDRQQRKINRLRKRLNKNFALNDLSDKGAALQGDRPKLNTAISDTVKQLEAPAPPEVSTEDKGGSSDLDAVVANYRKMRDSASYAMVLDKLKPILRSDAFADEIADRKATPPLEAAAFLSADEAAGNTGKKAIQGPHARGLFELIGGIAAAVAGAVLAIGGMVVLGTFSGGAGAGVAFVGGMALVGVGLHLVSQA